MASRPLHDSLPALETQQPKYALLAQSILSEIQAGKHPVGSFLPTEEALCQHYGVSRHTVRSALRLLQDKGFVRSQRPVGTRVIAAEPPSRQALRMSSISDIAQLTAGTQQMVTAVDDVVAEQDLAEEIGCAMGRAWRRIELLRWLSDSVGAPSMLSQLWINPMYGGVTRDVKLNKLVPVEASFIELIEQQCGVKAAEVRQAISSVSITGDLARALKVPPRSPGLRIQRWISNRSGDLIMYSNGTYNGRTFVYQTTLSLQD